MLENKLDRRAQVCIFRFMKFFLPLLVWLVMATIIMFGILMAVKGQGLWLLMLAAVAFIFLFSKYGCLSAHD